MRKRYLCLVVASILVLVVVGCGYRAAMPEPAMDYGGYEAPAEEYAEYDDGEYAEYERVVDVQSAPGATGAGTANHADVERLIIRTASLDIVVVDTEAALEEIEAVVDELGGFIVESNMYQYQEGQRASVRLRVPAESLDAALDRFRDLATEVRSEQVSGQDVTEEYVDLQSSLRHLEATEKKLSEFLEEAEDTEAALAVYERLQYIQADIERVKGRIKYLEESAAMSTVNLNITPDELAQPIQVGGWHPEGTLRDAFQSLIRVLQFLVDAAIVIIVLIVPTLAVIAAPLVGLFFIIRALVRRRRARKAG